jgi:hypothetical protein
MKKIVLALVLAVVSLSAVAQSREFIRNEIRKHGECKNVAITKSNGDLMIYGRNGWAATGCPTSLTNALHELNEADELIKDVQLTDNGSWLIIYGNNGLRWDNIPYSLEKMLIKWNNNSETITSVSFNDAGDWIAISTEHFAASSDWLQDWVAEGADKYGMVWATCVTDDAAVVVYEDGYRFYGNVPSEMKSKLNEVDFNVYYIKIAGTAWFMSDGKGAYSYHM